MLIQQLHCTRIGKSLMYECWNEWFLFFFLLVLTLSRYFLDNNFSVCFKHETSNCCGLFCVYCGNVLNHSMSSFFIENKLTINDGFLFDVERGHFILSWKKKEEEKKQHKKSITNWFSCDSMKLWSLFANAIVVFRLIWMIDLPLTLTHTSQLWFSYAIFTSFHSVSERLCTSSVTCIWFDCYSLSSSHWFSSVDVMIVWENSILFFLFRFLLFFN